MATLGPATDDDHTIDQLIQAGIDFEIQKVLNTGDMAIITKGDQDGVYGMTNSMKIVEVGQVV